MPAWEVIVGTVRKTITLTDHQDSWIKAQVAAGHYTHASAYIRDLIMREQERNAEIEAIRAALIEGAASGDAASFEIAAFKRRMMAVRG